MPRETPLRRSIIHGARAGTLVLQLKSGLRPEARPNFIRRFATLIYLDTFGLPTTDGAPAQSLNPPAFLASPAGISAACPSSPGRPLPMSNRARPWRVETRGDLRCSNNFIATSQPLEAHQISGGGTVFDGCTVRFVDMSRPSKSNVYGNYCSRSLFPFLQATRHLAHSLVAP